MGAFSSLISQLWAHLGLGIPVFDPSDGSVRLTVDERDLVVELSPNEQDVVVRATVASLSEDRAVRPDQMRRLLRDSLGLAMTNGAGTHLVSHDTDAPGVAVVGLAPCRVGDLAELVRTVEDVLQRIDLHAERSIAIAGSANRARLLDLSTDDVIIRL